MLVDESLHWLGGGRGKKTTLKLNSVAAACQNDVKTYMGLTMYEMLEGF